MRLLAPLPLAPLPLPSAFCPRHSCLPQHPGTELRFFLAQPPDAAALVAWLPSIQVGGATGGGMGLRLCGTASAPREALPSRPAPLLTILTLSVTAATWLLQEEVERHGDVVVLRGADTYRNLPNKTMRLLRYVAAHPGGAPPRWAAGPALANCGTRAAGRRAERDVKLLCLFCPRIHSRAQDGRRLLRAHWQGGSPPH